MMIEDTTVANLLSSHADRLLIGDDHAPCLQRCAMTLRRCCAWRVIWRPGCGRSSRARPSVRTYTGHWSPAGTASSPIRWRWSHWITTRVAIGC